MQQINCIKSATLSSVKAQVTSFYEAGKEISVTVKKTRTKGEKYNVTITGVYAKFFTVEDPKFYIKFTVQYVDVIRGNISIEEKEEGVESLFFY